jgi:hypothetical protein
MSKFVDSVHQVLGEGMAFTRWEHLLVIFDNIGFKRGETTSRVGSLQMTLLIMVRADRDLLVARKSIPDPAADVCGDILDSERKKWSLISEEEGNTYEKVVKHGIGSIWRRRSAFRRRRKTISTFLLQRRSRTLS